MTVMMTMKPDASVIPLTAEAKRDGYRLAASRVGGRPACSGRGASPNNAPCAAMRTEKVREARGERCRPESAELRHEPVAQQQCSS